MKNTPVVWTPAGQVIYELQPKQVSCMAKTPLYGGSGRHIGYGGAAGGGKSLLARVVATMAALKWPGSTVGIFRRTYPELRENHIVPFRQEVGQHGLFNWKGVDNVAEWMNRSRTVFGYLQRDEDVYRYQGVEFDVLIFEEATHYSWFQISYLTQSRLRSSVSGSIPFALYPSNPGNIGHAWYRRLFIDRDFRAAEDPGEYTFIAARVEDNQILLDRDPGYLKRLESLPEPLRSQLRDGDWDAGTGMALEIRRDKHLVPKMESVPSHWQVWHSYDWGYNHPAVWCSFTADEDGNVYLVDSLHMRHRIDSEQAEAVVQHLRDNEIPYGVACPVHAGHDAWNEYKARLERAPTTAEVFASAGLNLVKANISRVSGLRNMREYLGSGRFRICDTPSNRQVFQCLESIPSDPDNPEDALKMDADEYGYGGDDSYDSVRYGLAARMQRTKEAPPPPLPEESYDVDYHTILKRHQGMMQSGRGF